MQQIGLSAILAVAVSVSWVIRPTEAADALGGKPKLELVLHYDFSPEQVTKVSDFSGKEHNGTCHDGQIVYGRRKNAVKLKGKGMIAMPDLPDTLDPASRSLTVGAFCQPTLPNGVVAAMGDKANGFSLYLKEGVPQFVVRANGQLSKVTATEPVVMDQWVHLAGTIDAKGKLSLIVNGWSVASIQGKLIPHKPSEPFCVVLTQARQSANTDHPFTGEGFFKMSAFIGASWIGTKTVICGEIGPIFPDADARSDGKQQIASRRFSVAVYSLAWAVEPSLGFSPVPHSASCTHS